jgi:hypothetical protein
MADFMYSSNAASLTTTNMITPNNNNCCSKIIYKPFMHRQIIQIQIIELDDVIDRIQAALEDEVSKLQ